MSPHQFLALILLGCGMPVVQDFEGHPIRPVLTGTFEGGAIVIDSTASGLRAVVELLIEGTSNRPGQLPGPELLLDSSLRLVASRLSIGDSVCTPRWPRGPTFQPQAPVSSPSAVRDSEVASDCVFMVRAAFAIPDLRVLGDSVRVLFRSRTLFVHWRRK